MVLKSKVQIDFQRLLKRCESMVADRTDDQDWRLEKYINALDEKLNELSQLNVCQPSKDELNEFGKKVKFLRRIIDVHKLPSSAEKLMATQILTPISSISDSSPDRIREIHLHNQSKYANEVRNELFGCSGETQASLRKRFISPNQSINSSEDDVDAVLRYHHNQQEKAAEEMVILARNLKQNFVVANSIIKNDTETLERAAGLAEGNFENLKKSSDSLTEFVKRSCQYWLWIMLAIVSFTFLWMVVFIRIFTKN